MLTFGRWRRILLMSYRADSRLAQLPIGAVLSK